MTDRSPKGKIVNSMVQYSTVHKVTDISIEADILAENRRLAHENLHRLRSLGIRSVDVMGAIGSGKTLLITKMAAEMREKGHPLSCSRRRCDGTG